MSHMGDVPLRPEPPEPRTAKVVGGAADAIRLFITGATAGRPLRRPILFGIATISIGIAMATTSSIVLIPALISVMLLALTDEVPA